MFFTTFKSWFKQHLNRNVRKRTFWHVRPAKTQISLRICAVWPVFVVRMKKLCILGYPKCVQWRFWSDCANAQADLNFRWPHMSKVTFPYVEAYSFRFELWTLADDIFFFFFQENRPWHLMWVAGRFIWNVNPICTCGDNSRGIQNLISWENRFQTISGNVRPYLSVEMVSRAARQFIWNVSPYCGDNLRQMLKPTPYFLKKIAWYISGPVTWNAKPYFLQKMS